MFAGEVCLRRSLVFFDVEGISSSDDEITMQSADSVATRELGSLESESEIVTSWNALSSNISSSDEQRLTVWSTPESTV